jgi:RNA polymerase sigma-70 factor (ECF subfamily)
MGARLYATARRVVRDDEVASDCVHDVFLRLWRTGSAYAPARGSLEAFLVTCVRNEALARVRNEGRREVLRKGLPVEQSYDEESDPIERERIARAVASLSPEQQRSIELAYYRGLTFAEIASDLGEPLGTIKSRISGALRKLRERLSEDIGHA